MCAYVYTRKVYYAYSVNGTKKCSWFRTLLYIYFWGT